MILCCGQTLGSEVGNRGTWARAVGAVQLGDVCAG